MTELNLHFENFSSARNVQLGQQNVNLIAGKQYLSNGSGKQNFGNIWVASNSGIYLLDLITRLNPITDASHTRNRATSPPDSACFPGTRRGVIKGITSWVNTSHTHLGAFPSQRLIAFFDREDSNGRDCGRYAMVMEGLRSGVPRTIPPLPKEQ